MRQLYDAKTNKGGLLPNKILIKRAHTCKSRVIEDFWAVSVLGNVDELMATHKCHTSFLFRSQKY